MLGGTSATADLIVPDASIHVQTAVVFAKDSRLDSSQFYSGWGELLDNPFGTRVSPMP
jgi:hypothetical protein